MARVRTGASQTARDSSGKLRTTTIRMSEGKLRLLKSIAGYEGRTITEILNELVSEYIERYKETLEFLNIPGFVQECQEGLREIRAGGGKTLDDLDG